MNMLTIRNFVRPAVFLGSAGVIAIALSACVSPEQERYADQDTCSSMGARYGSSTNTQCMLQQQQRRDQKNLMFLEEARIHSELARNAQEMRDRQKRRDHSEIR